MKKYNIYQLFVIFFIFLLTSCAPIKIKPTFVNPLPSPVYHKDKPLVSVGTSYTSAANLEYQTFLDENLDAGCIIYGARKTSESETETLDSNFNFYGFIRQWFKSETRKNPWGNTHIGCQFSYSKFKDFNDIISGHMDFGFMPGIYRKNFNLGLALRGGAGVTFPFGYYVFLGAALENNFFISKNLGLSWGIDYTFGAGGIEEKGVAILAVPQLFRLSLLYRFSEKRKK